MKDSVLYYIKKINISRIAYAFKGGVAYFIWLVLLKKKKDVWIFGAGNGLFENNVAYFYSYIKSINPQIKVYFVTDREDVIIDFNKHEILKKGSFKCYYISFVSKVLIFDTNNSDICPGYLRFCSGVRVNLNHGQEGFKMLPTNYYKRISADIHCAVSEYEKKIKITNCGAKENSVYVTGQSRYDYFNDEKQSNMILMFFTWREGLQNESDLKETEYFINIKNIIESKAVEKFLLDNNIVLVFKPHWMIKEKDAFSGLNIIKNIRVLSESDNLSNYIRESKYLITDYSSICWDFIYNDRKVIFYQFDYREYVSSQGLYLDIQNDTRFLKAKNIDDIIDRLDSEYTCYPLKNDFFSYFDNKNSERIYKLIDEKLT